MVERADTMSAPTTAVRRPTPWLTRIVVVLALFAVEVAGLLLFGGALASTVAGAVGRGSFLAIAFGVAWFAGGGFLLGRLTRSRGDLRAAMRVTWLATAVAAGALFALTSFRTTTVHEIVAHGLPASSVETRRSSLPGSGVAAAPAVDVQLAAGRFHDLDENASGKAAVVRLVRGGRVLTLTDFSASNGPDVRVYLVSGSVRRAADVRDKVDLGGLKGNRGDQQYVIANSVDVGRYSTVVIYCRGFSIAFGAAELGAS